MPTDIPELKKRFLQLSKPLQPLPTKTEPMLQKLTGIRFVIFDFYGTLFISGVGDIGIDDGKMDHLLFSEALRACGIEADPEVAKAGFQFYGEEVTNQCLELVKKGYDIPEPTIEDVWVEVLAKLRRISLIHEETDRMTARKFAVEFEARMNPVWPMPGLTRSLELLTKKRYRLGIISNSQFYTPIAFEALTDQSISSMGFNPDLLHWSFSEHLKKPSLKFYNGFLKKMDTFFPGTSPSEILYVGNDMLKDIYPASTLGMRTALFAGDSRSLKWRKEDKRCKNIRPDLVITGLEEIPGCLDDDNTG